MRLTCPNCGAQYEVPEDVIPAEGRDVQCSNCGKTWFQESSAALAQRQADSPAASQAASPVPSQASPPQEDEVEAASEPRAQAATPVGSTFSRAPATLSDAPVSAEAPAEPPAMEPPEETDEAEEDFSDPAAEFFSTSVDAPDDDSEEDTPKEAPKPAQRTLDPAIASILRAEAQRETALRAAESEGLETQPELGLQSPPPEDLETRARETRERMSRLDDDSVEVTQSPRRELLPDIEEINSSLGQGDTRSVLADDDATELTQPRRRGFVRGFLFAVLIAIALVLVYQNSATIAQQVPDAKPYLQSYVRWVDETRVWLQLQAEQLAADPKAAQPETSE